jgi:hypothetical protein
MNQKNISTPILLVKNLQAKTTTLWVDINYANSFCAHLKEKKVNFKRSNVAISESGCSHDLKIWKPIGNEIEIEYADDIGNLLLGWRIPSTGL